MSDQFFEREVPQDLSGLRLDKVVAELFNEYSRSKLQKWIKSGQVRVNNKQHRGKDKVDVGDNISLQINHEPLIEAEPQPIALNILYEDEDLIIINKPVGLVVHPAAGNPNGTLLNGLLHYDAKLRELPRAGIVHRLDKDTSGLLAIARNLSAHTHLIRMLQSREIHREYRCIVNGIIISGGTVDAPIDRHPSVRTRMAVVETGKQAITLYRVLERFRQHSYLYVKLHSGRTHQIRVHMAYIYHPILGDPLYGGRLKIPAGATQDLQDALHKFRHQALHAFRLEFKHPTTAETVSFETAPPEKMDHLLRQLRNDTQLARS